MLKVSQRFATLLVLMMLVLTGCGIFVQGAPVAEEAQVSDTVEVERNSEVSTTSDSAGIAEGPASGEIAGDVVGESSAEESAVAEEPAAEPAVEVEKEVIVELEVEASKDEAVSVESKVETSTEAATTVTEDSYSRDGEAADSGAEVSAAAPTMTPLPSATASPADLDRAEAPAESAVADDVALAEVEEDATMATEPVIQQTEPLKAGEVDDNILWDDYLLYRRNYRGPRVHNRDVSERYVIEVVDEQGHPVLGANVRIFLPGQAQEEIYSAQTYATGQTLFHPLALDIPLEQVDRFQVQVQKDDRLHQFNLTRFEAQASTTFTDRWTVTLDLQQAAPNSINLDVLFLIDATGSMADEINKVQSTIFDVAAQIDALPSQPNVRYGMVTYRDRGDSFITNSYEFTPNVRDFAQNLSAVFADGGGDYPESLNEGLHDALHKVEWRGGDTVQLIFLIADAPPHLDYAQDYDYAVEMENAAQRGIKIFPIASSGLDDQGEYIFRQLAQYTQGRFIFLTYEGPTNSGAPGDTTTHHVDEADYSVENLDDLLVRLVEEELAYQNPRLAQTQ